MRLIKKLLNLTDIGEIQSLWNGLYAGLHPFPRDVVCTRPQSGFPRDKSAGIMSFGRWPSTTGGSLPAVGRRRRRRRCSRSTSVAGPVSLSGTTVADFETTGSPSTSPRLVFGTTEIKPSREVSLRRFTILPSLPTVCGLQK